MNKDKKLYLLCIIVTFFMFISIFFPWLMYNGQSYTIYQFYSAVKEVGGIDNFAQGNANIYPVYVFLMLPAAAGILSGIKVLLLIFIGKKRQFSYVIYALEWLYMAGFFAFGGYMPLVPAIAAPVLALIEFLLNRYLEEYREIVKKSKELKEKEQRDKEVRKRRLLFPGTYSKSLYGILVQSIRRRRKEYLLLIVNGTVSVTYIFVILVLQNILGDIHSTELLFLGNGLQGIMKEAMMILIVINAVMMAFSFSAYAGNKKKQDKILLELGARRSLIRGTWIMEYAGCLGLSLGCGYLLGNALVWLLMELLKSYWRAPGLPTPAISVYPQTAAIFAAVTMLSLIVIYRIYEKEKYSENAAVKKEKIPPYKSVAWMAVVGIVLVCIGGLLYSQRKYAESIYYIGMFIGGVILLVTVVCTISVKRQEHRQRSLKKIIGSIPFTYHFRKSNGVLGILIAGHFLILSVLTVQFAGVLSAPPVQQLFPYQFVCMAYPQDREIFAGIAPEMAEVEHYPMVRVTAVEGDAYDWKDAAVNRFMGVLWPQGQHVGISETTYQQLQERDNHKAQRLNLSGEEIHIVYQQDASFRAHPLDWYLFREKPYLRMGQPLNSYNFMSRERLYPPRMVKGEEIQIITGMFSRGMQENLVVLSDEYFAAVEAEGPTELYLLNLKQDQYYNTVKEKLEVFAEKHKEDSSWDSEILPYYDSREQINDVEAERVLKLLVTGFQMMMITICMIMILSLKFAAEQEEIKERYQLLLELGMKDKERKRIVRREAAPFFIIPLLLAAVTAAGVTYITFRLRLYGQAQILKYLSNALVVWGGYFLVQAVFYIVVIRKLYRSVQKS